MKRFLKEYIVDTIILADFPSKSPTEILSGDAFAKLKEVGAATQLFDCKNVVSLLQVEAAVLNALAAMRSGRNIARDLGVEFLVRLSTRREIDEAVRIVGVSSNTRQLGVNVITAKEEVLDKARPLVVNGIRGREIPVIGPRSEDELNRLARLYGVSDTVLRTIKSGSKQEALEFAVLERMATMDLK